MSTTTMDLTQTTGGSCPKCGHALKHCFCGEKAILGDLRRYRTALAQISRMKMFPSGQVNQTTLHAAIQIARTALNDDGDES